MSGKHTGTIAGKTQKIAGILFQEFQVAFPEIQIDIFSFVFLQLIGRIFLLFDLRPFSEVVHHIYHIMRLFF